MSEAGNNGLNPLGFRPLYAQVHEQLVRRIAEGAWQPGHMLPSESQIAAELGVSQGTVRKALDDMTDANLLVRRQGRGTFVARHDEARILFQFFKLTPDSGERFFPESEVRSVRRASANTEERATLRLSDEAEVIRIHRVRVLGGKATISEYIVLDAALFGGFENGPIPNNLYETYAARFGITIVGGAEKLKAVGVSPADAAELGLKAGTPVLLIDRVARSIEGNPVEWRVSVCSSEEFHYLSSLG
jgi:GntR family transcriptional regulator